MGIRDRDKGLPVVACTTGLTGEQERRLVEASARIGVLKSANMSLGVNLMQQLSAAAARFLGDAYDIEILEKHHNQKVDAPSGTALALADAINHALEDSKACLLYTSLWRTKRMGNRAARAFSWAANNICPERSQPITR